MLICNHASRVLPSARICCSRRLQPSARWHTTWVQRLLTLHHIYLQRDQYVHLNPLQEAFRWSSKRLLTLQGIPWHLHLHLSLLQQTLRWRNRSSLRRLLRSRPQRGAAREMLQVEMSQHLTSSAPNSQATYDTAPNATSSATTLHHAVEMPHHLKDLGVGQ
jgi:hypothetical protein